MRSMNPGYLTAVACGLMVAGAMAGTAAPAAAQGHAHVHPTEGPHHGSLIELGKEDYHAELVHDESGDTITIYILDAAATKTVPIPAKQLTLNLRSEGRPQQFFLASRPQAGDPEGSSSAFAATNRQLCQALDAEGASGRLNVEIAGRVYAGKLGGHVHSHTR
jgi:hypothetical protein